MTTDTAAEHRQRERPATKGDLEALRADLYKALMAQAIIILAGVALIAWLLGHAH